MLTVNGVLRGIVLSMLRAGLAFCIAFAGLLLAQSKPAHIYRITDPGVSPPKSAYTPQPKYSTEDMKSKKTKEKGPVVISFYVGIDGAVHDAKVTQRVNPTLDAKALEAVQTWKFSPCTKDGTPVNCYLMVEVTFHLYQN